MSRSHFLLLLFLTLLPVQTQATLVTETWQADVTETTNTSGYSIGETLTWAVTYNPNSDSMHTFHDGPNEIDNKGKVDDSLYHKYCISPNSYTDCDTNYTHYTVLADAILQAENIAENIIADSIFPTKNYTFNNYNDSWRYTSDSGVQWSSIRSDWYGLFARFGPTLPEEGIAWTWSTSDSHTNGVVNSHIRFNNIRISNSITIPEPSAITLFGLGLLAFLFTHTNLRKNHAV